MILAIVRSGDRVATLTESGWSTPDAPPLARILDLEAAPENMGPAMGDPVAAAAIAAAELIEGTVHYLRPPPPAAPDVVY